jgi:NhaP-type Na+/H+ or K+/H+ antiporter
LAGVAIGTAGGRLLDLRAAANAVESIYRQLAAISIAAAAFALAGILDGNGFIAAFTAGLAFGQVARRQCKDVQEFTEDEGELLSAITFVIFGAVMVGPLLDNLTWQIALYSLLSLTAVRILPVLVAMVGSGTMLETRLFLGWFGPRGLASILFALLVVDELDAPAGQTIFSVAAWTVLASIFSHGLTAKAWSGRLARRLHNQTDPVPEMEPVDELPTRRRFGL